jgi:hypothetical protein
LVERAFVFEEELDRGLYFDFDPLVETLRLTEPLLLLVPYLRVLV